MLLFKPGQDIFAGHTRRTTGNHLALGIGNHRCTNAGRVDGRAQDRLEVAGLPIAQRFLALQAEQADLRLKAHTSAFVDLGRLLTNQQRGKTDNQQALEEDKTGDELTSNRARLEPTHKTAPFISTRCTRGAVTATVTEGLVMLCLL